MKTDIHYLCKTNLGLLPLSSSKRCFLARGWRRASFMIRIFLLPLSCVLVTTSQAQSLFPVSPHSFHEPIDTAVLRVVYRMSFIPDIHQPKQKEEQELELLLGKRYEQFRFNVAGYGKGISKPSGSGLNIPEEGLAASVFIFDKHLGQRQTYIKGIAPSMVSYTEKEASPLWDIKAETELIMGHTCQKAVAKYLGRTYTAWFTSDIPVSTGPWKLRGLPGLILRVTDSNREYQFEAILIESNLRNTISIKSVEGRYSLTSREKVNELLKHMHKDILQAGEVIYGRRPKVIGSNASVISIPYNPIELE